MDFVVPADYRIKIQESENMAKYLDLARELKKLWKTRVTVILLVVGALGMVPKGSEKRLEFEIRADYLIPVRIQELEI